MTLARWSRGIHTKVVEAGVVTLGTHTIVQALDVTGGMAARIVLMFTTIATIVLFSLAATAMQDAARASWLDRPLTNWNTAGGTLPRPAASDEPVTTVISRCKLQPPRSTAAERAIEAAGWIPFWNVDQQLVREDVEIVGGMRAADGMCRPVTYNLFVFVSGRFAGTLSPVPMVSRLDGSSGAVRIGQAAVTAEFARYTSSDPLCCPSSRVTVSYRIERTPAGPLVAPADLRTTRP
jgi:hypothetical protein